MAGRCRQKPFQWRMLPGMIPIPTRPDEQQACRCDAMWRWQARPVAGSRWLSLGLFLCCFHVPVLGPWLGHVNGLSLIARRAD